MNLPSLRNKYQENSRAGIASSLPPCCTSYVVPFLDRDSINMGLFKRSCATYHGSGDSKSNVVLECKWETTFSKERAKLKEKRVDTTLCLASFGAKRKNEPNSKNLVTSPSHIAKASKGPNPTESMLKPNNSPHSLMHMGCTGCDSYFTFVPMADQLEPKCPVCRKNGVSLCISISSHKNKRARKN